jgi:hypothetical protein
MNLKALRQTLASALADANIDYSTSAFPPPVVIPPTVVIVPGNPWIAPILIGDPAAPRVQVTFRLTCIVANLDNQGSLDQLEDLVFAVLTNIPAGWEVGDVSPPSVETIGPSDLLVSDVQITTITVPTTPVVPA